MGLRPIKVTIPKLPAVNPINRVVTLSGHNGKVVDISPSDNQENGACLQQRRIELVVLMDEASFHEIPD